MNKLSKLTLLLGICIIHNSCKKDDENFETAKGEIAIATSLVNPDGFSGSSYLQLINDLSPQSYDNKTAYPISFGTQPKMIGENIYELPFFGTAVIKKYTRTSTKDLGGIQELIIDANSHPTQVCIQSKTKGYITLLGKGKIIIFNPETMEKTGEIDLKEYGIGDENPDPSGMVIRNNMLFVALNQMVGGYFPDPKRAKSDVLIVDTKTDKVMKMITEETSKISQPTRPVDSKSIFIDEHNDIYIVGLGGFGALTGHKAGLLRIKNGETEFDSSYKFVLSDAKIEGFEFKMSWAAGLQYVGEGKLYALVNIPALLSEKPNFITDKSCVAVVIDLKTQTIKKLKLPHGNGYCSVGLYNNKVMFGLSTAKDSGFYTYDLVTNQASTEAVIKTVGSPIFFRHFGERF